MAATSSSTGFHHSKGIPLRIAVVQFNPKIGEIDTNIARARELCLKLRSNSIDLLCFPEMAFTGYVFDSADAISPYLEVPRTGPTSLFCKELARNLGCYVVAGYPERLEDEEIDLPPVEAEVGSEAKAGGQSPNSAINSSSNSQRRVGANSAILYGPSGEWVGGYRKTNLFMTDVTWAKPGTGFASFSLPLPPALLSNSSLSAPQHLDISLGICMDLNPQPPTLWTLAEGPYELADHCVKNNSKLLILLNAWLEPGAGNVSKQGGNSESEGNKEQAQGAESQDEDDEPEWHTLEYWAARLRPLWQHDKRRRGSNETILSNSSDAEGGAEVEGEEEEKPSHETIVVVCNRTGEENGKTFAGSSSIFSMQAGSGRPKLLDMMGKRDEGVRIWNLYI